MIVSLDEPMCCVINIVKNMGLRLDEALRMVTILCGIENPAIRE